MKEKLVSFCKAQPVLVIAFLLAVLTMFWIPPDKQYIGYCNRSVLIQLFSLMTAVAGMRSIGIFEKLTSFLLQKAGTVRKLGMIFVCICFFSSMFVTNDVALLTFVPLTLLVYEHIPDEKSRILTIVLETAAANLGSMMTPVGNPQNLYLYAQYHLSFGIFFKTMLPAGLLSLVLLLGLTWFLPKTECTAPPSENVSVVKSKAVIYSVLFIGCLLTVARILPNWVCLGLALLVILLTDKTLFRKVDYTLLLTFVCFFVFVGNMARIEPVRTFFAQILTGRELVVSALLSQVISNVPAAVMLSGFTQNGIQLLLGVNLGGLGTLIASLASLISYQFYRKSEHAQAGKYLLVFSAVNFGLLMILLMLQLVLNAVL